MLNKKKILITGAYSYIGISVEKYLMQWDQEYQVDVIDMMDRRWRDNSFINYDAVLHLAGIAHQDTGRISKERYRLYFSVNRDLTIEVAKKAKNDKVKHFIHMSSMSVYGRSSKMGFIKEIDTNTVPHPVNAYGKSKLQADNEILKLADKDFIVTVLRPPMVYGAGCKGNYQSLSKAAQKLPVFPIIQNKRSMIYIGNLAAFIKNVIDKKLNGILFPQNNEFVCTSNMVKEIALVHGKKIRFTKLFNPIIRFLSRRVEVVDKVFGNLTYKREKALDGYYDLPYSFRDSIYLAEGIRRTDESEQA